MPVPGSFLEQVEKESYVRFTWKTAVKMDVMVVV